MKPRQLLAIICVLALCTSALAAQVTSSAKLVWQGEPATSGDLVKARVPGGIAQELARPGTTWQLRDGSQDIPAQLTGIGPAGAAPKFDLSFTQYANANSAELVLLVDQGEKPQPLNQLQLDILAPRLNCTAQVSASNDSHSQGTAGPAQLLYQEIDGGRIIALTDLAVEPADKRWLRVTLTGAAGVEIKDVSGRYLVPGAHLREIPLTLGTPVASAAGAGQVWPIVFGDTSGLVRSVEFSADAPGVACEIAVATLDAQNQPVRTLAQGVWADRLQSGKVQRSLYSLAVPLLDPHGKYGLVASVAQQPVEFAGAKAFAQDAWLVFIAPSSAELTLWINPQAAGPQAQPRYNMAMARTVGEFGELVSFAMPGGGDKAPSLLPEPLAAAQAGLTRWWRPAAYAAGALVLLIAGFSLLRHGVGHSSN